ncbi:MAG: hypothetical protein K2Q24_02265 [Chitinophagaceae bacterium]|jgi:hypothetical protein|nr:hypothetical protein [Chitinophagaceae bacterium]
MKIIMLIAVAVFIFTGCVKKGAGLVMQYNQTACTDKWGYGIAENDEETKAKLGIYLDSLNIAYSDLRLEKLNAGDQCDACFCKTGKVFTLKTTIQYKNQLEALGFKKK